LQPADGASEAGEEEAEKPWAMNNGQRAKVDGQRFNKEVDGGQVSSLLFGIDLKTKAELKLGSPSGFV
jgi:hypothetical protein